MESKLLLEDFFGRDHESILEYKMQIVDTNSKTGIKEIYWFTIGKFIKYENIENNFLTNGIL